MTRSLILLIVLGVFAGCASHRRAPGLRSGESFFLQIARSHTSAGSGAVWTISDNRMRVSSGGVSPAQEHVLHDRLLSRTELEAVSAAIERCGIRHRASRTTFWSGDRGDALPLSDGIITTFQFVKGRDEKARDSTVMYWGELDEAGMAVARAVDELLPTSYQISPPLPQAPNKAPEPTP